MNPHPDEVSHRDRESAERHHREQYPAAGTPHHSNAGSLPIHQPVASRLPGAIHSPGGLLANHGGAGPVPMGGPSGPNSFGPGPIPPDSNRPPPHNAQNASNQFLSALGGGPGPGPGPGAPSASSAAAGPVFGGPLQQDAGNRPGQAVPFAGAPGPGGAPGGAAGGAAAVAAAAAGAAGPQPGGAAPGPGGSGGLPQGQQPILNDALSYLDQVKVQFADQPDVYNKFLDIMKDFKSQTIDTPGVINRVSELFAGHPNLIQGFNTFLPPGYRIECGAGNDPNTIRVTTPMGTTVQSITGRANQGDAPGQPTSNAPFMNHRPSNWQAAQPQHSIESPEATFSAPATNGPGHFGPGPGPALEGPPAAGQQQSLRSGQGQPPNKATTPNPPSTRNAVTPTPSSQGGAASQQANMEKRGPVEFNHAISYVNKIKNRFQDSPGIYKQFLEILQTYQREQKPIQDVYAQVTSLFNAAPDLLEDFKQFLPESAASNKKSEDSMLLISSMAQTTPQPSHTRGDMQKMPPVGNFAPPPSASKDTKKRSRNEKQQPTPIPPSGGLLPESQASGSRLMGSGLTGASKRPKLNHRALGAEASTIEPTLTPVMPEPLQSTSSKDATADELAFFEKVKKHLGNRSAMNEFLKLCNMYSQNLINTNDLMHKASQFIGGNPELMSYFQNFMNYTGGDDIIENRPLPPTEKVSLSNCRGCGPSYRLLPRREKLRPCGGRDEMCHQVLNDEWASHPTWASEDSGFVSHRKNAFEEGLHRIEEERHDYDFNIEANLKCIQLLEPLAQTMLSLDPSAREHFQMPDNLGGPSTAIFKRVLKKIYGADRGAEVVNEMFAEPFAVVPIVLARLKQKDEEWRFTQREWEKVWQAQTETMHIRSLDHMGNQVKQNDKKSLSAKHLVDVIKTKHEEQRRQRGSATSKGEVPRFQFAWEFDDQDLLLDLLRFMALYALNNGHHSSSEKTRILEFFETFIPSFFELPEDKVLARIQDIDRESDEEEADDQVPAELSNGRSRRNGRKADLLRGVLDPGRNGTKSRQQKEGSVASGSKETTPEVGSANEDMTDSVEDAAASEMANIRWLHTPVRATVLEGDGTLLEGRDDELKAEGSFTRPWYNFFCNQTIYVFFSVFHTLYKRLKETKKSTDSVREEIKRSKSKLPAKELGIAVTELNYFDENDEASFWPKTVGLIEDFITGDIEENYYQDVLRHYYLKKGWTLYTIQDLMKTLCRLSLTCTSADSKEKTPELISHYIRSRDHKETTYQTEINSRKFAEKCVKDGDVFVICWYPNKTEATVRWLTRDETTFCMDDMARAERWQYYISSYIRVDQTESVNADNFRRVALNRNLPLGDTDSDDGTTHAAFKEENLRMNVCINTNKIYWEPNTSEYAIHMRKPDGKLTAAEMEEEAKKEKERADAVAEHRAQRFREKMVFNAAWMRGMSQDEVQKEKENFQTWFHQSPGEQQAPSNSSGDKAPADDGATASTAPEQMEGVE